MPLIPVLTGHALAPSEVDEVDLSRPTCLTCSAHGRPKPVTVLLTHTAAGEQVVGAVFDCGHWSVLDI